MPKISQKRAKILLEKKNVKLIDVRSPVDFARGTIPGAVNIPIRNISQLMRESRTRPLIFFGDDDHDFNIKQAENYAIQMGFLEIYTLGSLKNWTEDKG